MTRQWEWNIPRLVLAAVAAAVVARRVVYGMWWAAQGWIHDRQAAAR